MSAGCHGWVGGTDRWMAPTVTSPCISQTQQHGEQPRQLGWEPETLPAVPSSTTPFLSPHLPPVSLHPVMPPELSQLSVTMAGLVTAEAKCGRAITPVHGLCSQVAATHVHPFHPSPRCLAPLCLALQGVCRCIKLCALFWHCFFLQLWGFFATLR